jgi:hypothetical protein
MQKRLVVTIRKKRLIRVLNPAVPANSAHNNVFEINAKAELFFQCLLEREKNGLIALNCLAAFPADDMVMVPFFGMVIDEPVAHLALVDAPQLFQQFQRAVDGGLVHAGLLGPDPLQDFFTGMVPSRLMDNIQY